MAESSPDEAEFNELQESGANSQPGVLRHTLDPRTWNREDWIVTIAPLVVEAASIMAPEVTLPVIGVVDTAKALRLVTSTPAGRAVLNATAGFVAGKGHRLESALTSTLGGLAGEVGAGAMKGVGRKFGGGLRKMTLNRVSNGLSDIISNKLPKLASGLHGGMSATGIGNAFRRARPTGRSAAEHIYGGELDSVEDKIDHALTTTRQAGLHTRLAAIQAGKPLRGGGQVVSQELFPVHVYDQTQGQWGIAKLPFKDAVATMREKLPKGYTMTGTPRDTIVGDEWRKYRMTDSRNIGSKLVQIDPALGRDWQSARNDWAVAHHLSDIFADPKSYDPVTGEINSQHVAKHLYGDVPGHVSSKQELSHYGGSDFANKIHATVIHEARTKNLPQVQDVVGTPKPGRWSLHIGLNPARYHPGESGFVPRGTEIPFKEQGRPKVPYSILRALGRSGAEAGKEGFLGED